MFFCRRFSIQIFRTLFLVTLLIARLYFYAADSPDRSENARSRAKGIATDSRKPLLNDAAMPMLQIKNDAVLTVSAGVMEWLSLRIVLWQHYNLSCSTPMCRARQEQEK